MRYFTRELYDSQQDPALRPHDEGYEERVAEAHRKWQDADERYYSYISQHNSDLSESAKTIAHQRIHDARVVDVREDADTFFLDLDMSAVPSDSDLEFINATLELARQTGGCFAIPRRKRANELFRVVFRGVRRAKGIENIVGDYVLYHEVHVIAGGLFEFSALCGKSEFSIRFATVELGPIAA